ncbi:MAG: hypothetical protein IH991_08085, partial [Planctomycetes bacterium]|nr:hypothetical protein [Planctomycetota bacterium]
MEVQALSTKLKIGDQTKQKETDWKKIDRADLSLADVTAELIRVTEGLGRVWRHCTVTTPFNGSDMTVRIRPDPAAGLDPNDPAAQAGQNAQAPHQVLCDCKRCKDENLERSNKMYVFREVQVDFGGRRMFLPGIYLGEFQVSGETRDAVTLTATMVVNVINYNLPELENPTGKWALYARMPTDGHDVLQGLDSEQVEAVFSVDVLGLSGAQANTRYARFIAQMEAFERNLDPADQRDDATLRADYPQESVGLDPTSAANQYNRYVHAFEYDHKNLNAIPADSPLTDDQSRLKATPEETWVRVQFAKAQVGDDAFEVDSPSIWDADAIKGLFERRDQVFDIQGKAVVPRLRQGSKTEFSRDDKVLFDQETANDLINRGIAEPVENVFVRKLNDFAYLYRVIDAEDRRLAQKATEIQREFETNYQTLKTVRAQIAVHEIEREKLLQDRENFRKERKLIADFKVKLQGDVSR